ncbi:adenosylcobinamide-GDP ribazoletransferase [Gordonia zhaorongruii]|uniref:adenosylcobinamide-GDP ribazoletransferase n=1 Tax=Gordonia zhaorongruii TaxID=2597659 RepID=UPI0010452098|nr:adenosylcobinamide-GDP ribazoletransferase [Gordonia zhaorongruii]
MWTSPLGGLHVAFSWLTVAPLPSPTAEMDRRTGGRVIATAPVVGVVLGGIVAGAAYGLSLTRLPDLLVGLIAVGMLALLTRGMHLDGVADTADGLGCYGAPDRVRTVMRSGDIGPFGAATLILLLAMQSAAVGVLAADGQWLPILWAVGVSRVAVVYACRVGIPPANADGFGALVAGTQRWSIAVWTVLAAAAAPLMGSAPLGVRAACALAAVAVFTVAFTAHCRRRIGGVTGDVLGAVVELSTTIALLILLV